MKVCIVSRSADRGDQGHWRKRNLALGLSLHRSQEVCGQLKDRRDCDVIAQIGGADRTRIGSPPGYLEPICSHLGLLE